MNLQSMTGFARAAADHDGTSIAWEVKSVNGKSVEVRLRLPPGFERLEPAVRQAVQKRFSRGNFQATLTVGRAAGSQAQPVVNEAFLKDVAGLAKRLQEQFGVAPASADGLLAAARRARSAGSHRERGGPRCARRRRAWRPRHALWPGWKRRGRPRASALKALLLGHIDAIEALTLRAEADPSREPAAIRQNSPSRCAC